MKKLIYFIMLLTLLICTTGCVTFHEKFEREDDIENIISIEVYFVDVSYETQLENLPTTMQPIKILDKELFGEVIQDLESLDFKSTLLIFAANDPNFDLYGYVIKIVYNSGIYQLVSNAGACYTYDSNGYINSFHSSVKEDVWNNLIIKYIGEEEFNQHKLPF
ncbi:MAG: hypothetical protein IKT40_05135 [Bacilli bacterium]|nr:hypothetical protein [Bacilli bacterium]